LRGADFDFSRPRMRHRYGRKAFVTQRFRKHKQPMVIAAVLIIRSPEAV
jgi:hypothetical protein